ncbi:hypothetical protein ACLB2K_028603 [Fragaria x ananassa]
MENLLFLLPLTLVLPVFLFLKRWRLETTYCASRRKVRVLKVEVEGDSKLVIDIVNGVCDPPWRLVKVFQDNKLLSCNFESIRFRHVFREANFMANVLANLRHRVDNSRLWVECVPPEASLALTFDSVNSGCRRGTSL